MARPLRERSISAKLELPQWFNMQNYSGLEKLNALGWYEQLSVRFHLFKMRPHKQMYELTDYPIEMTRKHAVVTVDHQDPRWRLCYSRELAELKMYALNQVLGVRLTPAANFYTIEQQSEATKINIIRSYFAEIYNPPRNWQHAPVRPHIVDEPIDRLLESVQLHKVHITVNTTLPDDMLVAQFKTLLKELRNGKLGLDLRSPTTRKMEFDKWIRLGLLPYIDLHIWELENNKRISFKILADTLLPEGEGDVETISKTTRKIAKHVLNMIFIDTLASFAAQEVANQLI